VHISALRFVIGRYLAMSGRRQLWHDSISAQCL
jgi:hypothetical protein